MSDSGSGTHGQPPATQQEFGSVQGALRRAYQLGIGPCPEPPASAIHSCQGSGRSGGSGGSGRRRGSAAAAPLELPEWNHDTSVRSEVRGAAAAATAADEHGSPALAPAVPTDATASGRCPAVAFPQ